MLTIEQVDAAIAITHQQFYRTDCEACGKTAKGTYERYSEEMCHPDAQWRCLNCGIRGIVFDDDYYEDNMEIRTMLILLRDILSVRWSNNHQIEVADKIYSFLQDRISELAECNGIGIGIE